MKSLTRRSGATRTQVERYELDRSPFAQRPTQRDIASLLNESRNTLRDLVNYKEQFIVRRQIKTGKKQKPRDLAYPEGRLRGVHERLKFHLTKIKQPGYLFSPRKGRGQRDNAAAHLDQDQYLTLDLKQFYPSTSRLMVKRWFIDHLAMDEDVAGLLVHLSTVDERVSFGSPLTPVLCSLVHRPMFDAIAQICESRGLRYTVWVDDLTISGRFVPRVVLHQIREIVRKAGLRSHDIKYRTGNKPVFITGIGVVGSCLVAPRTLHIRIRDGWSAYHEATTVNEKDAACQILLSQLGTLKQIAGSASMQGRRCSDEMNSLRQKRAAHQSRSYAAYVATRVLKIETSTADSDEPPWD